LSAGELRRRLLDEGVLLCILGPTAVGKTELAIELARRIDGEIISADSRQVYKLMDIGTAKPTPQQRKLVPHHVIDCVYPDQTFSAAEFVRLAEEAISDIRRRGKVPLLVGGTGLYFRALVDGLFEGPSADEELRRRLREEARLFGPEHLHTKLRQVDPDAAAKIHPNDLVRVIRALEVYEKTGKPISKLQKQWRSGSPKHPFIAFCLSRGREELYRRIEERVDRMMEMGFLEEVKRLLDMGYSRDLPSMQTFGYKELAAYLCGEIGLEEAIREIKKRTRRFARKQIIWFRGDDRLIWVEARSATPERLIELALTHLDRSRASHR